jgi:hypothetical protein
MIRMASLASSLVPVVALALALPTTGCVIVDDDDGYYDDHHGYASLPPADNPVYATIDADQTITTNLGEGAGLFVEYASGGTWRLWTSCDTAVYGGECQWEAYARSSSPILDIFEVDLEGFDEVVPDGSRGLVFYADTAYGSDAIEFTTEPGAPVELSVYLDGVSAPDYVVWFGNAELNEGAFGSPIIFTPDVP